MQKDKSRKSGTYVALSSLAFVVFVFLLYSAFIWRACEPSGLSGFVDAFMAFHTREGC